MALTCTSEFKYGFGPFFALFDIRYVVDGEWLVDPSKEMVTDSKGNTNNVVVVEDRLRKCKRQVGGLDKMKKAFFAR